MTKGRAEGNAASQDQETLRPSPFNGRPAGRTALFTTNTGPHAGNMQVNLVPKDDRPYSDLQATERVRNALKSELPGVSVFYKDENGDVFHTYSSYARGGDILLGAYNFLDLTPKGRNEMEIMDWVKRHDEYQNSAKREACCNQQFATTDRRIS